MPFSPHLHAALLQEKEGNIPAVILMFAVIHYNVG